MNPELSVTAVVAEDTPDMVVIVEVSPDTLVDVEVDVAAAIMVDKLVIGTLDPVLVPGIVIFDAVQEVPVHAV